MSTLRGGACAPWLSGAAVENQVKVKEAGEKLVEAGTITQEQLETLCAESATAASDVLYELSGQIYTGECGPVTVRPVARPIDGDMRVWAGMGSLGWSGQGGLGSSYGWGVPGVMPHYGKENPPEIDLGIYPVTEIEEVKINGVVIPVDEYELRDNRVLVRIRPTASSVPTERFGWPTSQAQDLPDTQENTFSVTYKFGQPPPALGMLAAGKLAEVFALPQLGGEGYPRRITQMSRQGVTAMITDVMDLLQKGMLGIYEVDAFIMSVNPGKNQRQAAVFSPDIGRARRVAS